jgi:hypothetical protein
MTDMQTREADLREHPERIKAVLERARREGYEAGFRAASDQMFGIAVDAAKRLDDLLSDASIT